MLTWNEAALTYQTCQAWYSGLIYKVGHQYLQRKTLKGDAALANHIMKRHSKPYTLAARGALQLYIYKVGRKIDACMKFSTIL